MNGIARKSKRAFIELADYAANLRDPEEPDMVGSAIDGHTGNAVAAAIKAALECGVLCTDRRPLFTEQVNLSGQFNNLPGKSFAAVD